MVSHIFSRLISMFVCDILHIPSGRTAPTCTPPWLQACKPHHTKCCLNTENPEGSAVMLISCNLHESNICFSLQIYVRMKKVMDEIIIIIIIKIWYTISRNTYLAKMKGRLQISQCRTLTLVQMASKDLL
jgi:hypothetical protein